MQIRDKETGPVHSNSELHDSDNVLNDNEGHPNREVSVSMLFSF